MTRVSKSTTRLISQSPFPRRCRDTDHLNSWAHQVNSVQSPTLLGGESAVLGFPGNVARSRHGFRGNLKLEHTHSTCNDFVVRGKKSAGSRMRCQDKRQRDPISWYATPTLRFAPISHEPCLNTESPRSQPPTSSPLSSQGSLQASR
jgi:hypothetical protein